MYTETICIPWFCICLEDQCAYAGIGRVQRLHELGKHIQLLRNQAKFAAQIRWNFSRFVFKTSILKSFGTKQAPSVLKIIQHYKNQPQYALKLGMLYKKQQFLG